MFPTRCTSGADGSAGGPAPAEEVRGDDRPHGGGEHARGEAAGVTVSRAAQRPDPGHGSRGNADRVRLARLHLHQFETACGSFGKPDDDGDWGFEEKAEIVYVYDFGDDWRHDIVAEKITPALPGLAYPRCTGGRGWASEEDSGGIWVHSEAVAASGPAMPFTLTALGALSGPAKPT